MFLYSKFAKLETKIPAPMRLEGGRENVQIDSSLLPEIANSSFKNLQLAMFQVSSCMCPFGVLQDTERLSHITSTYYSRTIEFIYLS
ncbi:hypothetical protein K449DRAFT_380988 [Hypoxylon sp. EC38]|nr:hypothetical protein K449DRAFT_380988 [Hypoxylon sp. EC38]